MAGFGKSMQKPTGAMDAPMEDEQAGPMPPRGMGPQAQAPAGGGNPDQPVYERFVRNGLQLIYSKQGAEAIVRTLEGDGNPVEGMANVIASVVTRLVDSAAKAGKQLPDDVVLYGTGELIEALADLSKESGGHDYSDEEQMQVAKAIVEATEGEAPAQQGAANPAPVATPSAPPRRGLSAGMQQQPVA